MSRLLLFLASIITLGLLLTAGTAQAKVFQFKTSSEYPVEKNFKLSVANTAGSIQISYRAGDKIVIESTKEIDASSREEAERLEDRLEVIIKADRDNIEVDTRDPYSQHSSSFWERLFGLREQLATSVKYIIEVPTKVRLEVNTTSGDVDLLGLAGEATVSGTSGDIKVIGFTGDLNVETTSGDLSFKDVTGNIDANSTSSDMLFDNVTGDVIVQSTSGETEEHYVTGKTRITKTSGNVRIQAASGDIEINTTSGNIDIEQREGAMFVSTASGDVHARSDVIQGKRFEIETISGDVTLQVPAELKGRVKLETVSGAIDTDLAIEVRSFNKHRLEGRVGGDGPEVVLSTTSGDISLNGF
jgi:DUF4097 and DUF4098 domain-containing protein YvlB